MIAQVGNNSDMHPKEHIKYSHLLMALIQHIIQIEVTYGLILVSCGKKQYSL